MKKTTFICFLILLFLNKLFADNQIFLRPIQKSIAYNNISLDELNPFLYSTKKFFIDSSTTLLLLDEYNYTNGFYNDILKVLIIDGQYKDEIAYILEEKIKIYKTKECKFFVKEDFYLEDKVLIKKNIKTFLEDSFVQYNQEYLKLRIEDDNGNSFFITTSDKSKLHFLLNKLTEINYNLQKGAKVIKVIESTTAMPIKDAACYNEKSDHDGIIYVYNSYDNKILIEKEGYTSSVIENKDQDQNLFLAILSPTKKIDYYDDRTTIYEYKNYQILIDNKNLSFKNSIFVSFLDQTDLSIFSFPSINNNKKIKAGFFVKNIIEPVKIEANVSLKEDIDLLFFDLKDLEWKKVTAEKRENDYKIKNLKDGYYIALSKEAVTGESIEVLLKGKTSNKFIRNRGGDFYTTLTQEEKASYLPDDQYEIITFDITETARISQRYIKRIGYENRITLELYKDEPYLLKKNFETTNKLSHLFYGNWQKRAIKYNNNYTALSVIESLGDMTIKPNGKVEFISKDFIIKGFYDVINNKKIEICINHINKLINKVDTNEIIKVDPSLFNSQLIIKAYYSYYAGVLKISFDNIYFLRNMKYLGIKDKNMIEIISKSLFLPDFPEDEKNTIFTIYFVKTD